MSADESSDLLPGTTRSGRLYTAVPPQSLVIQPAPATPPPQQDNALAITRSDPKQAETPTDSPGYVLGAPDPDPDPEDDSVMVDEQPNNKHYWWWLASSLLPIFIGIIFPTHLYVCMGISISQLITMLIFAYNSGDTIPWLPTPITPLPLMPLLNNNKKRMMVSLLFVLVVVLMLVNTLNTGGIIDGNNSGSATKLDISDSDENDARSDVDTSTETVLREASVDVETSTTDKKLEQRCISLKQPTLKFKADRNMLPFKSLIQLKCRGKASFTKPTITKHMQVVLDVNGKLFQKLDDRNLILHWNKKLFQSDFSKKAFDMCSANNSVVYYLPNKKKCGFVTRSCDAKNNRYPFDEVIVIMDLDIFDDDDLDMMYKHLLEVYDVIPSMGKDWQDVTQQDLIDYKNEYGITPYLKLFLYQVIHRGGDKKQGVLRMIYGLFAESAIQWQWKPSADGNDNDDNMPTCRDQFSIHEWLHYDCTSAQYTISRVEEYLKKVLAPSVGEICKKKDISKLQFTVKQASVSWPPRHTMKEEKLHVRPTQNEISSAVEHILSSEGLSSDNNDIDGVALQLEEAFGIKLTTDEVKRIMNGGGLDELSQKISELDEPEVGEATIIHATHLLYDKKFNKYGSKELGLWKDPLPRGDGSNNWGYDAKNQLSPEERQEGIKSITKDIAEMKKLHGHSKDAEDHVVTRAIDKCIECFRGTGETFESLMDEHTMLPVGSDFDGFQIYGHR